MRGPDNSTCRRILGLAFAVVGLLAVSGNIPASESKSHAEPIRYTGSWWFGPDNNGEGLAIQSVTEDRSLVYWFTMTPEGDQAWVFGEGSFSDGRIVIEDVFRPIGARFGEAFNPDDVQLRPWGRMTIDFESCSEATLEYSSEAWGKGERSLSRLNSIAGAACQPGKASPAQAGDSQSAKASAAASKTDRTGFTSNISGAWWDPAHNGEGFVIQMPTASNGNGTRALIYWFTYDPDGNQAWIAAQADVKGRTLEVQPENALMPSGAEFGEDFDAEDVTFANWGDFEIAFGDGEDFAGTLTYEAKDEFSGFGSGEQQLTRFMPPADMGAITRPVVYGKLQPIETLEPLDISPEGEAYMLATKEVFDINQDGLDDVIAHLQAGGLNERTEPSPIQILINEGDGTMTNGNDEFFPEGAPKYNLVRGVVIADFNGDECPDIFFSTHGQEYRTPLPGEANGLVLSNPDCTLREVSETHLPHQVPDVSHGSTGGDFDNDGDVDLYVNNLGSETGKVSYLMENDGTGHFKVIAGGEEGNNPPPEHPYFGASWSKFVDANGDDYPDLFLPAANVDGYEEPVKSVLLINSGEPPYFSRDNRVTMPPPAAPCGGPGPVEEDRTGDINGDGLTDIILSVTLECTSEYVQVLINQEGSAKFADKTTELMPSQGKGESAGNIIPWLRDLDGNGLDDILIYTSNPEDYSLRPLHYLQDGSGHFQRVPVERNIALGSLLAPVDINGDGVLDLVNDQCSKWVESEERDRLVCKKSRYLSAQSKLP
jgi:hypothetical protein